MFFSNMGGGSNDTTLYKELGVEKNVTQLDLKRAYKQLALKFHPDRNKDPAAEERFKKVSCAYEILSDQGKRSNYDKFGLDAVKGGGSNMSAGFGGGGNPFDIFENLFKSGRGPQQQSRHRQGRSIVREIEVDLQDIYIEKKMNLSLTSKVKCSTCNGVGCKNGKTIKKCVKCDGSGVFVHIQQVGPGMISQNTQTCDSCHGNGKQINPEDKCTSCNGTKCEQKRSNIELQLLKTHKDGDKLVFSGKADYEPDATLQGDLIIILKEQNKKSVFQRLDNDLLFIKSISLIEALCGMNLTIKHMDGRELFIKTSDVIQPESIFKITGEGMAPAHDLLIKFNVVLPMSLSEERKQYIQKVIQQKPDKENIEDTSNKEIKFLDTVSFVEYERINDKINMNNVKTKTNHFSNQSNLDDEDDDSAVPACAQQ
jgi:DnaJ family protein A protein 2